MLTHPLTWATFCHLVLLFTVVVLPPQAHRHLARKRRVSWRRLELFSVLDSREPQCPAYLIKYQTCRRYWRKDLFICCWHKLTTNQSDETNRRTSYGSDLFQDAGWVHYTSWWGHNCFLTAKSTDQTNGRKSKRIKVKQSGQNYMVSAIICETPSLLYCNIIIPTFPFVKEDIDTMTTHH